MSGQELATAGGRARFVVEVKQGREGEFISFKPRSTGKARRLESDIDEVLEQYNRTRSMRPCDYTSLTQNASYVLALIGRL
jgi:hypothetical protein